ncbi:MAG: pilin protein [Selenomonadaceae bacterium]|nr:pilin protein [Selenomonadaceae bacterium]MDY3916446.1 pilin protein [Selenomonadaceae bacterium]
MLEILKYLKARYMTEKAQGIVEYALILAFVVALAAVLTGNNGVSAAVKGTFSSVVTQLKTK